MSDLLNTFGLLFRGFMSAHGTDEGGCKWAIVNRTTFERHISGEEMIGIYPMVYNPEDTTAEFNWEENEDNNRYYPDMQPDLWHCKWGAIDIDEGDDSLVLAKNVSVVLSALNIPSWVELSRSMDLQSTMDTFICYAPSNERRIATIRNTLRCCLP